MALMTTAALAALILTAAPASAQRVARDLREDRRDRREDVRDRRHGV